jgi:hypothetical protein
MSKNQGLNCEVVSEAVKVYVKPAIVHDLKLETRAGSPLGGSGLLIDPLGVDPAQPQ